MAEPPRPPLLPEGSSFNLVEAVPGVVTRPVPTLRQIAASCPWWLALLVYIGASLLSGLAGLINLNAQFGQLLSPAMMSELDPPVRQQLAGWISTFTAAAPVFVIGSSLVLAPIGLFISAGLFWLLARMLGGQGPFGGLFAAVGFAGAVPPLIQAPLVALLGLAGPAFSPLISSVSLIAAIWSLILDVIAIRESMNLSTGRAIAVILLLIVLVIVLCCVVAIALAGLIASLASSATGAPRKP